MKDNDGDLRAGADYLEVPFGLVQAAVAYYGSYPNEVDQWIELNEHATTPVIMTSLTARTGSRPA